MGMGGSATCTRCGKEDDTALHFLLRCEAVARVRSSLFGPSPTLEMLSDKPHEICRYVAAVRSAA